MKTFFYLCLILSFKNTFAQTLDCSKWSTEIIEILVFNDLYGKEIEKVEEAVSYCDINLLAHNRHGDSFVSLAQRMSNHSYREYFCKNNVDPFLCNISYVYNFRHDLEEASKKGNLKKVEELLKKGAHPDGILHYKELDYQKNLGKTPLFLAIENEHLEVAKLLISYGARVEIGYRKEGGLGQVGLIRPLGFALTSDKDSFVKMLVSRGASIFKSSTFDDRKLPLTLAYEKKNLDIFLFMTKNSLDDVEQVEEGVSKFLFKQTSKNEKWFKVAKKLIDMNRFDPKVSYSGKNLLTHAILHDSPVSIVQKLIDIGADVDYRSKRIDSANSHEGNPLKVAIYFGRIEIIKLLLSSNPNLDIVMKGHYGNINLLMHAMFNRSEKSLEMVNLLLDHGVTLGCNNTRGSYFVKYARKVNRFAIDKYYRHLDRFLDLYVSVCGAQKLSTVRYIYDLVKYGNDTSLYFALRLLELGNKQYLEGLYNRHEIGDTNSFAYYLMSSVGRGGADNENRSKIIQFLASNNSDAFNYRQAELGVFHSFPKFENNLAHYMVLKEIYNTGKLDLNKPVYLGRFGSLGEITEPPLLHAIRNNKFSLIRFLLEHGVDGKLKYQTYHKGKLVKVTARELMDLVHRSEYSRSNIEKTLSEFGL